MYNFVAFETPIAVISKFIQLNPTVSTLFLKA